MHIYPVHCEMRNQDVYVTLADELSQQAQQDLRDLSVICVKFSCAPICTADYCPDFGRGNVGLGGTSHPASL